MATQILAWRIPWTEEPETEEPWTEESMGLQKSDTAEVTKHSTAHIKFGGILRVVLSSLKTNFHFYAEFRKSSCLS